jgi:hypothetical protein
MAAWNGTLALAWVSMELEVLSTVVLGKVSVEEMGSGAKK